MTLQDMGFFRPALPMRDRYTFPPMPDYRSSNTGPGYDARENEFRRLQSDALNSPNFAREYLRPERPYRSDYLDHLDY